MTNEQKVDIAGRANQYISEKGLTAAAFSTVTGVNQSYLSNILNGVFAANAGGSKVDIADKYFIAIAKAVGYAVQKTHWPHVNTREFMELVTRMKDAKEKQIMKTLIVETGAGKTYAINQFKKVHPLHTYVITLHSLMTINDVFNEMIRQLNIPERGSKGYKRYQIIIKLHEIRKNGGKPAIYIDEGENMTLEMMKMIKGFYDAVYGFASVVMVGTEQLWELMQDFKQKYKQGGPQYFRRFKAGTHHIRLQQKIEVRFQPFFEELGTNDKSFRKLLCEICDNYGELHDYLEPALREADEQGVPLTEEFFRVMYDMPKLG